LLQGWLNECSDVLFLFERQGGFVHYPLQIPTLLYKRNGKLNKILTLCTCLLKCHIFRLVVLLVMGMFLLVVAIFVVLRWHNSVNHARISLLALDGSIDDISGTRMFFAGGVVSA